MNWVIQTKIWRVRAGMILKSASRSAWLPKITKKNYRTNRGTSEGPKTSEQEYLTRRNHSSGYNVDQVFLGKLFWKEVKIDDTKLYIPGRPESSSLGAFQRRYQNCHALLVCPRIFFVFLLGIQSSCTALGSFQVLRVKNKVKLLTQSAENWICMGKWARKKLVILFHKTRRP